MTKFSQGNSKASKLSNEDVLELRRLYHDDNWTQAQLARHYQLNINTVGRIVRGESRQHVPMPTERPEVIQQRMIELQRRRDEELAARLSRAIAAEPTTQQRAADQSLEDWEAAKNYGVTKP